MTNQPNKIYNPNILLLGFAEGSYDNEIYEEYANGNKIIVNKKQGENIEEVIKLTDKLLGLSGVH